MFLTLTLFWEWADVVRVDILSTSQLPTSQLPTGPFIHRLTSYWEAVRGYLAHKTSKAKNKFPILYFILLYNILGYQQFCTMMYIFNEHGLKLV